MKKNHSAKLLLICLSCLLTFLAGCGITMSNQAGQAKYERAVQLSAPLSSAPTFAVKNHNGSITIGSTGIDDCNLSATITARAATIEEARELAEKTKIKLERFGNKLTAKIDKPGFGDNRVSVNLNAKVPRQTNLELLVHNGAIEITDIAGRIDATTYNGEVTAKKLSGTTKVETHNGSITCMGISGDTRLVTYNGNVKTDCSEATRSNYEITIVTHNGGIEFVAPPDLSARLNISTQNGSVNSDLPISVSRSQLKGTIGTGQGKLHLETHNGSVRIQ